MVQWTRGLPAFSAPLTITLSSLLFEPSSCPASEHPLLLVRDVTRYGIPIPLLKKHFYFFRFSFRGMSDLSPFPFSAIAEVIDTHVMQRSNLTGKLYFVCKQCWIHIKHVSTLSEPCWGCAFFESIGWEL